MQQPLSPLTSTFTFSSAQDFKAYYFRPYGIWDQDQTQPRQMPRSQPTTVPGVLGNAREKACQGLLFSNEFHFSNNSNLPRGNWDNQALCQKAPSSSTGCILSLACRWAGGRKRWTGKEGDSDEQGRSSACLWSPPQDPLWPYRAIVCASFLSVSIQLMLTLCLMLPVHMDLNIIYLRSYFHVLSRALLKTV